MAWALMVRTEMMMEQSRRESNVEIDLFIVFQRQQQQQPLHHSAILQRPIDFSSRDAIFAKFMWIFSKNDANESMRPIE